jgi:hypothetical protein
MLQRPSSVLNVGDMSYADGYQPRWDTYGRMIEPSSSTIPWMVIEGNHEQEVVSGKDGFLAYNLRYHMPSTFSKSGTSLYYSYELAGMHIIMLGCYTDYGADSEQLEWLKQDLASVDRGRTPWLIVGMHAPWYNSNEAHSGEMDDMRDVMEDLLFQYGTDLVFAGHVHAYERSLNTYHSRPNACGPTYINIGDGGNREGLARDYFDPQPEWSAFREASYGHGILEVMNSTHATWEWHRNQDDGFSVGDSVDIVRAENCHDFPGTAQLRLSHTLARAGSQHAIAAAWRCLSSCSYEVFRLHS